MRLFTAVFTIALTAFFLVPVSAQQGMQHAGSSQMMPSDSTDEMPGMMGRGMMHSGMKGRGMMQNGMMSGMMSRGMMHGGMMSCGMMQQSPMMNVMMMVKMLPEMQEELTLTQNQSKKLIDMRADFQKQQIDYKTDLRKKRVDLENMLKQEATAGQIKKQMQFCSNIKIDMHIAAYETLKRMKTVLNDDQKEMLKSMNPQQ
ncbi:MAG: hypothetical protein U5R06_09460 [candidate division KSB1 bacterium]|nr:hypothetical protein [candidate division KSB1 bacterium]